ncbi:MAG: hypothetical protein G01um101431_1029 [Parcubacteria group bacterium Gr01-1014_31]|nr:MAG: hypothetical protein G01um101431_1029 [Parcubacteria group bacterium Gr01-1014_31]
MRVALYHVPEILRVVFRKLPAGARLVTQGSNLDYIHYFCVHRQALAAALPGLKTRLRPNGMIWVSWPKKSSGIASDVDENVLRHLALQQGLVDVKVVAVDRTWSGLKLVIPRSQRGLSS